MNKIFKVIWNPATGSYSVASETAKNRGKKTGRRKLIASTLIAASGMLSTFAYADNVAGTPVVPAGHNSGDGWVAIGKNSTVSQHTDADGASTAIGDLASALGRYSTSIGARSSAGGDASTALGVNAYASGNRSTAVGASSEASGSYSMAMGVLALATGDYALAFGEESKATGEQSLALGFKSESSSQSSIAMGSNAKASSTDALAIGRESSAAGSDSMALGRNAVANNTGSLAMGTETQADFYSTAVGYQARAYGWYSLAMGSGSKASGEDGIALGHNSDAVGNDSIAMGARSFANATNAIALGTNSQALTEATIAIGQDNKADGKNAIALGNGSQSTGLNAISLGLASVAITDNSLALGSNTAVTGLNSVALGADSKAEQDDSVSVGSDTLKRKIVNVQKGAIGINSTDAINGSQLYGLSSNIANYFGGNAAVDANGNFTGPTYNIDGTDYHNVGDALSAIDDSIGDAASDALRWDSTAGEYSARRNNDDSKITDVAKGDISAGSTDAVNGSQLNDTNMRITQIAGDTSATYIQDNGAGVNYIRTNDTGLVFEDASASGVAATAVGYNASASGASSIAIGQDSSSTIEGSIALGSGAMSSRVISSGSRATSVTSSGVTIGYDTTDEQLLGALSLGKDGESYRQIINVADGTEAHDVVTVRQLQNAIGSVTTTPTMYFHANSTAEDSLAVGEDSLAMGAKTVVNGDGGIGIGYNTVVVQDAINGIAIGGNASVNHAGSVAIGYGSRTSVGAQTNYTAYNMDTPQNSVGEFSVGSSDGQRQITNVAAGSQDTDAVNVGQLKITDDRVSQNTQNIAWMGNQISNLDTRINNIENGSDSIVVTGDSKYFKANSTGTEASAQGEESVSIGSGSIAAADNSVALGAGSVADEENTVSVGSSSNQRRITNVAAGKNATDAVNVAQLKSSEAGGVRYDTNADGSVNYSHVTLGDGNGGTTRISNVSAAVDDNDAVNYAQLKQNIQETKQYTDQRMVEMDNKLSKTESKLSGGIASAMAMTGLPQAYTPGASMASIGGGTYNGESAVALGVSMVSANGRWVYKLQGSTNSQGEYSAAVGAGIQW